MKLRLHEAIAIVLLYKKFKNRSASFEDIEKEIIKRKLYLRGKDDRLPPIAQIKRRIKQSNSFYNYLFEFQKPDRVKLKNH